MKPLWVPRPFFSKVLTLTHFTVILRLKNPYGCLYLIPDHFSLCARDTV